MNLNRPRSRTLPVHSDDDGSLVGEHTEHWSDAVDAKVFALRDVHVRIPTNGLRLGDGILYPLPEELEPPRTFTHNGRVVPIISGGAWSVSGLYVTNFIDILDATQLAIDTSLNTHKWALYNNTITPSYSADSAYSATNEITNTAGTAYVAGGQTILSPTTTESPTGTLMYDMADQVWAAPASFTAYGGILYADVLAGNNLIVGMYFGSGSGFTCTAGTFTIQFASTGVFTIDLTP